MSGGSRGDSFLSYEAYYERKQFLKRYNPEFLQLSSSSGQSSGGNIITRFLCNCTFWFTGSCVVCFCCCACVFFAAGLFLVIWSVTTRSRNIRIYNHDVKDWNSDYRQKLFGKAQTPSVYYFSFEEDTSTRNIEKEGRVIFNRTTDKDDIDDSAKVDSYEPLQYKIDNYSMFVDKNWDTSATYEVQVFNGGEWMLTIDGIKIMVEESNDRYLIKDICVLTNGVSKENVNGRGSGNYGCFKEQKDLQLTFDEDYYVMSYEKVGTETVYSATNRRIELRSYKDPWILLYDRTEGDLNFGVNYGVLLYIGIPLLFLFYCCCCCDCCCMIATISSSCTTGGGGSVERKPKGKGRRKKRTRVNSDENEYY